MEARICLRKVAISLYKNLKEGAVCNKKKLGTETRVVLDAFDFLLKHKRNIEAKTRVNEV